MGVGYAAPVGGGEGFRRARPNERFVTLFFSFVGVGAGSRMGNWRYQGRGWGIRGTTAENRGRIRRLDVITSTITEGNTPTPSSPPSKIKTTPPSKACPPKSAC